MGDSICLILYTEKKGVILTDARYPTGNGGISEQLNAATRARMRARAHARGWNEKTCEKGEKQREHYISMRIL